MLDSEEETYNEITKYYDFAEKLEEEVIKMDNVNINDKKDILLPMIEDLKATADLLIEQYINFLKNKDSEEALEALQKTLDDVLIKVDICRNKVYDLYKEEL